MEQEFIVSNYAAWRNQNKLVLGKVYNWCILLPVALMLNKPQ